MSHGVTATETLVEYLEQVSRLPFVLQILGAYALHEHLETERTGNPDCIRLCFQELLGSDVIHPPSTTFLDPHVAAAGAAAEASLAPCRHFHQLDARDGAGDVARGLVHPVVTPEVAGIMVGDGGVNGDNRLYPPLLYELSDEFAVVLHLVLTTQMRILILDGVKPESTEGRPWGQPLKKPAGAPLNLG